MHNRALFAALCGGLVAGTLDIGVAALLNSASPLVVLVFIASGVFGARPQRSLTLTSAG